VVRLRAAQQGSHVVIEVCDDGAGIGVERVRAKAVERGMISAERATHQSERELQQWLFVPGFSTASTVTNVSGRGVGMDVVRTNVEKIGGKVELESRPGKGTTLRLRIPLTLETRRALLETLHHYVESDGGLLLGSSEQVADSPLWSGVVAGGRFITGRGPGGNSKEWGVVSGQ
jgi:chemotaxis protein histidine kinase CheA